MTNHRIRLYHDIDGVLFAAYGPRRQMQLRPGLSDWLYWVANRFDLVWLTSWPELEVRKLLDVTYNYEMIAQTRYLPWTASKSDALLADVMPETPWLWIDDEPHHKEDLEPLGLARRFVRVDACRVEEFDHLRQRLVARATSFGWEVKRSGL